MAVNQRARANFVKALGKLASFLQRDTEDEVVRTAIIQAFEYTFESAWKLSRSAAIDAGLTASSPRAALQVGLSLGSIPANDEDTWLAMISDRNLTVHTYNEDLAVRLLESIRLNYLPAFQRFGESFRS